jgi:hypothetical protein
VIIERKQEIQLTSIVVMFPFHLLSPEPFASIHALVKLQAEGHVRIEIRQGGNTRKLSSVLTDKIKLLRTLEKKEIRRLNAK